MTGERMCFRLQVRPDRMDEYRRRHAAVWPEMLEALSAAGWRNYSLFLADDGMLIGYAEFDDTAAALAAMEATDVNARWQAEMAELFEEGELRSVAEVFHLEDELDRLE